MQSFSPGHNPVGENEQMPLMEDSISFAESSAAALAKELTKKGQQTKSW